MSKFSQIFNKLQDDNTMFEKWFEEYEGSDNFLENIGSEDEEQLEEKFELEICESENYPKCRYYKDLKEVDKKEYLKLLEEYQNKKIKEQAETWFYDRQYEMINDFEKHASITPQGLVCYRTLTVEDTDEFLLLISIGEYQEPYTGVGIYWAFDENKAEAHWSQSKNKITLKALIPFSAIDQDKSFILNFCPSIGSEEAEIRVFEGSEIIILGTDTENFNDPFQVKA